MGLQIKEMRQSIQTQIRRCCNLCVFEELPGMQGDGRMVVEEKRYEFPDTTPGSVAVLRFALARIILLCSIAK